MTARTCPVCARRYTALIDPDCPVCAGTGTVLLGQAALTMYPPQAVSRAVDYMCEAAAREAADTLPLDDRREYLVAKIGQFTAAGIIAQPPVSRQGVHQLAQDLAGFTATGYRPGDAQALDAPPRRFHPDERPLAEGAGTQLSDDGHHSQLLQLADPPDDEWSVHADTARRAADDHAGRVLAEAASPAVKTKNRRHARKAS